MPDPEATETEVTFAVTGEDGETVEVTQEEMTAMLGDNINVREVTVAVGETRQLHEFQPNNYHLTMRTDVSGVRDVVQTVGDDHKKAVKKLFLSLLIAKMAGQVASMKRFIHAEQVKDGFDVNSQIDWRRGEKEKILGEGEA